MKMTGSTAASAINISKSGANYAVALDIYRGLFYLFFTHVLV